MTPQTSTRGLAAKRKRSISLVCLLTASIGLIAWLALRPREPEPVYQGKTLSQWLAIYDPTNTIRLSRELDAARDAILHMDTNAIPALLQMLRTTDSSFKSWLIRLVQKQHVVDFHVISQSSRFERAAQAMEILGPRAECAVPKLIEMYEKNPDRQLQIAGVFARLGATARPAIPALLRETAGPQEATRYMAIVALNGIHSEPDKVVPVLIKSLKDPSGYVRFVSVVGLTELGPDARPAVPALLECLNDCATNTNLSGSPYIINQLPGSAKNALIIIDPETAAKTFANTNLSQPRMSP